MAKFGVRANNYSIPHFVSAVWDEDYFYSDVGDSGGPPGDLLPGLDDPVITKGGEQREAQIAVEQSIAAMILIGLIAIALIFVTILGNLLVLLSFALNRQLRILTNYFLLSLAVADCCIGLISMPLYAVFILMGRWPFGSIICDLWLTFDYVLCNASVYNLLVICCDRYFSLTRPLTYRASRTPRKVFFMIASAWVISLVFWSPWIFGWSYIEGERTVPPDDCYVQFLAYNNRLTSQLVSLAMTILAFYLPVAAMSFLYFKVYGITRQRTSELKMLQANKRPDSYSATKPPQPKRTSAATAPENVAAKQRASEAPRPPSEIGRRFVPPRLSRSMMTVQQSSGGANNSSILRKLNRAEAEAKSKSTTNNYDPPIQILPSRPVSIALAESFSGDQPSSNESVFFSAKVFTGMRSIDSPSEEDSSSTTTDSNSKKFPPRKNGNNKHAVLSRLSFYLQDDGILKTMGPVISALRNGDVVTICGEPPQPTNQVPQHNKLKISSSLSQIAPCGWLSMVDSLKRHQTTPVNAIPSRVVFDEESLEPVLLDTMHRQPSYNSHTSSSVEKPLLSGDDQSCHLDVMSESTTAPTITPDDLQQFRSNSHRLSGGNFRKPFRPNSCSGLGKINSPSIDEQSITQPPATENSTPSGGEDVENLVDSFPESETRRQSMFAHFKIWSAKAFPRGVYVPRIAGSFARISRQTTVDTDSCITTSDNSNIKGIRPPKPQLRRVHDDRAAERKAAKMLTAILLVFVLTWLPYNVLTNLETFCAKCVPITLYQMSYWLCYINSTLNPLCYAYCNATFRNTFIHILRCNFVSLRCCGRRRSSRGVACENYYHHRLGNRNSVGKTDSSAEIGTTTGGLSKTRVTSGLSNVRKTTSSQDVDPGRPHHRQVSHQLSASQINHTSGHDASLVLIHENPNASTRPNSIGD